LINLVGNAIKFTDRGGVTIKVSRHDLDAGLVAASIAAGNATDAVAKTVLHFAVEDTGIGIAEAVQRRLFHAFEQADSSTTRSYGGTGLGLAISRELVEKMGGRIGLRSTPGRGSEFWFSVPLDRPLLRSLEHAPGAHAGNHTSLVNGVRVLLAEDNPINQDVALTMLQSLGCHVQLVDTGVKALAALANSEFDIVLMDRQMPEMDGFDTTAAIRSRGLLRPTQPAGTAAPVRLPVIGVTASALKGDREVCLAAGMDDYLAKPFRRDALRIILERWVLDQPATRVSPGPRADEAPLRTFDRRILDQMAVSQRAAGPRMVSGLIDHYVVDAPKLIETLAGASERSDAAKVAHAAHLLGLGSEFVGAQQLAELCGELEHAACAGEMHALDRQIARIREEYGAVRLALETVRADG
jgi:CheY-like chemotaxis protein